MTESATTERERSRRSRWLPVEIAAWLFGLYAIGYVTYAIYLFVFGNEGELPPAWRNPDIPASAEVVSESQECASGGCSRALVIHPPEGQTAKELAAAMGLTYERELGWRWYDPHSVYVRTQIPARDELVVAVGYTSDDY